MWNTLGDLLDGSIEKAGLRRQISDAMLCEAFNGIAKKILHDEAEHCRAVYVKEGCMWVAVLSSAVANELKMREASIVRALEESCGAARVNSIRFIT